MATDASFGDPTIVQLSEQFNMVRCGDKGTAVECNVESIPSVLFFDADMDLVYQRYLGGIEDRASAVSAVEAAMKQALELYQPKEIEYATGDLEASLKEAGTSGHLVGLVFTDERKEKENAKLAESLRHPMVAKYHDRIIFHSLSYTKESEEAKIFRVTQAPAVVLINPLESDAVKRIAASTTSTKPPALRGSILKALAKLKKEKPSPE